MEHSKPISEHTASDAKRRAHSEREEWLDRALEDTFPASDPIAANIFD